MINPIPTVNNKIPTTKVGQIKALTTSDFPSCQNPILATTNTAPNNTKNFDEKISPFAQLDAIFKISIVF